jgi:hypothetical protein
MKVAILLEYCATCPNTRSGKPVALLESIVVEKLRKHLQIDHIDFWHVGQKFKWCLPVQNQFSKLSDAYPMEMNESQCAHKWKHPLSGMCLGEHKQQNVSTGTTLIRKRTAAIDFKHQLDSEKRLAAYPDRRRSMDMSE